MNIRPKVTALIASVLAILVVAEILVAKGILMPSFAELERSDAHTAMRRISYALDLTLERLSLSAIDWGNWADTYRFAEIRNPDYITANMTAVSFGQLAVNVVLICDLNGHVILSNELDLRSGRPLRLDFAAWKDLPADFPWRVNLRESRPAKGLLRTNLGILMLAAAPVLDGNNGGPSRGMVMMGRLLSAEEVARIGSQAQVNVSMTLPRNRVATEQLAESDTMTHVSRSFADIYGQPVLTLGVDVPRDITSRGRTAVAYASAYLMGAAVIVLILLVLVLNRVVLTPLSRVTRHAVALGEHQGPTAPLDLGTQDEIGVLARELDRMVEHMEQARTQLIDQSFQAGFAELARGVLHNLGNAMTPVGVRLSRLSDRLREAPVEDAERAVDELGAGQAELQRRADLEEFVHLACKELARVVKAVRSDVDVMGRQVKVVQTALSEQMRLTRNEHVIEPVRLPELIAQSLEIVPDASRQRLIVQAEESLKSVGTVQVARTVLRLILQNVIINAADAVRDAGRSQGMLRIGAEIIRENDREQLYLHCKDDGIGISADQLERVFEKGFSTKSKETNHGIGLHWCANAIGALGGRMWAASEGIGRGASLHLMVPLAAPETATVAAVAFREAHG